MIDEMIKEMEDEMAEAKRDEEESQKDYEETMNDAAVKRSEDSKLMVTKEGEKAEKTTKLEELKETKRTKKGQLEVLEDKIDNLHKTCDFLVAQYAAIKEARTKEEEGLKSAKSVLAGANFNFARRELTSELLSAERRAEVFQTELSSAHHEAKEMATELSSSRAGQEKAEQRQVAIASEVAAAEDDAAKARRELRELHGSNSALLEASVIEAQRPLRLQFSEVLDEVEGLQRQFQSELRRRDKEWADLLQQKTATSSAEAEALATKVRSLEQIVQKAEIERRQLTDRLERSEAERDAAQAEAQGLRSHSSETMKKDPRLCITGKTRATLSVPHSWDAWRRRAVVP